MEKTYKGKTNIEIVKSYLEGERLFPVFGYTPPTIERKIGDEWTDTKGITWRQEDGYRTRVNKTADAIRSSLQQTCKKCKSNVKWGSKLDYYFFKRTGLCETCLIDYETKLRSVGIYADYECYKLLSYELGSLKEAKAKLKEIVKYFTENSGDVEMICNSEGFTERWKNTNRDEILKGAKNDLKLVRRRITKITKETEEVKKVYSDKATKYKLEAYV